MAQVPEFRWSSFDTKALQVNRLPWMHQLGVTWMESQAQLPWREVDGIGCALVGGSIFVFGGAEDDDDADGRTNSMHVLDYKQGTWRTVATDVCPPPRYFHNMVLVADALYIYGGFVKTDLWEFNIPTSTYREISQQPMSTVDEDLFERREHRFGHSLDYYESANIMVLFGGSMTVADVQAFNLSSKLWTEVLTRGRSPEARGFHCSLLRGDQVFVAGGILGEFEKYYNDVHLLTFTSTLEADWSTLSLGKSGIRGRGRASMAYMNGALIIIGGIRHLQREYDSGPTAWYYDIRREIQMADEELTLRGDFLKIHSHGMIRLPGTRQLLLLGGTMKDRYRRFTECVAIEVV